VPTSADLLTYNTVESQFSELQVSERISYQNTKNPLVARANRVNFLTTTPHY